MKAKKILIFALLIFIFAASFLSINFFSSKKTYAHWAIYLACVVKCTHYAVTCPEEVRDLCYSDCMDFCCTE
ncbi:MAG: hypothetical protein GTO45_20940 [Candidatus Aminicenantes bacterium]|nr:hypothetical protein [Candidatus Aminicenantes bacterium]NIM77586.1 hypothetical protein [Candidatus Aminicenantes bacterium]NIN20630.1 hypothetical protein [Candidatus Aminicenantes bacterium]NIN44409.1 hypothetical protein [Candidatus Aminicenantes bacterium]NIN87228.1 hypothetical protein [Candidatus Aminicenantes bacterium]